MKVNRRHTFRKIISFFLLGALSLFVSPKELVHEFLDHHDSKDIVCLDGCEGHVGNHHLHCDVFQLSSPPICHQVNNFSFSSDRLLSVQSSPITSSYHFTSSPFLFFRGPPSLI